MKKARSENKVAPIMPTKAEDRAINEGVAKDPDTVELDARFFKKARRGRPPLPPSERKRQVTMLLDPDVVAYFKSKGRGWQTRVNAALRVAAGLK